MLNRGTHFFRASVQFFLLAFLFFSFIGKVTAEPGEKDIKPDRTADTSHYFITNPERIWPLPQIWFRETQWIILDEHNKKIHEFETDSLAPWHLHQWFIRTNGHEWIVDNKLNPLTPVHYEQLDRITDNLVLFKEGGKSGVMQTGGKKILEARYDYIRKLDGLLLGGKGTNNTNWKIYNLTGEEVSPFVWQEVLLPGPNGLIPVKRNDFWGFIDQNGKQVMECVYDSVGSFVKDRVAVTFKGLYGIVHMEDRWLVHPGKSPLIPLNERLYIVKEKGLTNIKSYETGTVYFTSNPIEMKQGYFIESLEDGTFWKINYSGRIINSAENLKQYEEIRLPSEGFIAVKISGRYGFIDEQDRLRIANRYDQVQDYHEGLAAFKLLNRWGFINKHEKIVVQPLYDSVGNFRNGIAIVSSDGKYGAINALGNEVVALEYSEIIRQENGRFIMTKSGKKGLLNEKGRIIVNPKYDEIKDLKEGHVIIKKYGKYGVVSRLGDDLIPAIYDQITYDPFNGYYLAMKKN